MRPRLASCVAATVLAFAGCADEGAGKSSEAPGGFNNANNGNNSSGDTNVVPETEEEFDFAEPAVLGPNVFVPNETLNSVAVIDSRTLSIRTVPVGFNPTHVVGPSTDESDGAVFVLNEGSSTVSIVSPDSLETESVDVLRRANALQASPDGSWALAWFDAGELGPDDAAGDLSAATLVTANGAAHQLAVGFRIERVVFTPDNTAALLVSDDGVSVVRVAEIEDDALVPPVAVLTSDLQRFDRSDREVTLDPDGAWAVARVIDYQGVVLTDLETGDQWSIPLPATPTDLDWVTGEAPRVLGMMRGIDAAFLATVPEGLIAASESFEPPPAPPDMGMVDAGSDAGSADMGADAGGLDAGGLDAGGLDVGGLDAGDAGPGSDADGSDASSEPDLPVMPVAGFNYLPLAEPRLGAAEVAPDASTALLFSTVGEERAAILLELGALEQRGLSFEKGVRGAIADDDGKTFVVLHSKEEGNVPQGSSPSDPEYIARSWGVSIVDVASGATRLVLTDEEPGPATLWTSDQTTDQLFMIFVTPPNAVDSPSLRDVLRVDLESFATDTFRVPSLPEGVGRIDAASRVYVNQIHPQGRITFVDVASDRRQTVTGYQLNSGID